MVSFGDITSPSTAEVKLLNIVGSTSLFLPTASLILLSKAEINNLLNQQFKTI